MDAFYASVELLRYPDLAGQPVVIGGGRKSVPQEAVDPATGQVTRQYQTLASYAGRGVITTATYAARKLGVGSAMGLMKAAKLAPEAILLPADFDAYRTMSRTFKAAVRAIAPVIEDRGSTRSTSISPAWACPSTRAFPRTTPTHGGAPATSPAR
jgi:DNA polymerase-4